MPIELALFEPDIPQNVGSFIRLAACMGVGLNVIEPCGFVWDERKIRQVALDYMGHAHIRRHISFAHFEAWRKQGAPRVVLLTTKAPLTYVNFTFRPDDILLLGRESSGVPAEVMARCDARVTVPLNPPARSLNVALAASMVLGEALRQTNQFPKAST